MAGPEMLCGQQCPDGSGTLGTVTFHLSPRSRRDRHCPQSPVIGSANLSGFAPLDHPNTFAMNSSHESPSLLKAWVTVSRCGVPQKAFCHILEKHPRRTQSLMRTLHPMVPYLSVGSHQPLRPSENSCGSHGHSQTLLSHVYPPRKSAFKLSEKKPTNFLCLLSPFFLL